MPFIDVFIDASFALYRCPLPSCLLPFVDQRARDSCPLPFDLQSCVCLLGSFYKYSVTIIIMNAHYLQL